MSIKNIVMLGTGSVGKSAITIQYVSHYFSYVYNPTIEDSFRTTIEIDGSVQTISILDTAGQEEYSSLRDSYIRSGDAFVIVYSIVSKASFLEANQFREEIYRVLDKDPTEHIPVIMVGNKCDLESERQVSYEEVKELCDIWGIKFLECSAKEKININELYELAVREVIEYKKQEEASHTNDTLQNTGDDDGKKKKKKKGLHKKSFKKFGCSIM